MMNPTLKNRSGRSGWRALAWAMTKAWYFRAILPSSSVSSPGMSMAHSRAKVAWSRSSTSSLMACSAPSGNAIMRTGMSRLDSQEAAFTRCDPARAMDDVPLTIGTKSDSPGTYAVPAAHGPSIAATSGTTPDITTSSRNSDPERANCDPAASCMRAPAESSSHSIGMRRRTESSRMRATLDSPTPPIDPAITVKS